MPTDVQKSWLLGGGYDWRAFASANVSIDKNAGISLLQTRQISPPPAVKTTPTPRYLIGRLGYDIDRAKREIRAYTLDGKLRHRWGPRDSAGNYVPSTDSTAWDPVDMVGDPTCVFILERNYQTVFKHSYGRESLSVLFSSGNENSRWSRIGRDSSDCLLLFDDLKPNDVSRYTQTGKSLGPVKAPWPASLSTPSVPPSPTHEPPPAEAPFYSTDGYWMSQPLDSSIYNCPWHRIELTIPQFPPGTQIDVFVFAYKTLDLAPLSVRDSRWITTYSVVAPIQPPPDPLKPVKPRVDEFLIQATPGQFLSILIKLRGDGFGTPVIQELRVHFPRESYLAYLPPLYSANEPMRAFLDSFLSVFQTEWDEFDQRVDDSTALFDPAAVPEGAAMNYLASWLSLSLEGTWTGAQNRLLLEAVPKIQPIRGTAAALRAYVAVYLANFAGVSSEVLAQTCFPAFLEGFRERQYLMLSQSSSRLGHAQPLWSDSVAKRLQLGGLAQEGQVDLVSTGDPQDDFFQKFAHRFRVYVPAAWVHTAEQESFLRRAIEAEMPAHLRYDLCLVEAGFRVGIQSTVGFDTIVGDLPAWRLPSEPDLSAPSLPPLNGLGYGTALSCVPGAGPAILDSRARVENWILD
jgi:phage tail-like protein